MSRTDRTSTKDSTLRTLLGLLPRHISISDKDSPLCAKFMSGFTHVVTYYSTVFIDCLVHGIPCIIYTPNSLDITLPVVKHPLLYYAYVEEEFKCVIEGNCFNQAFMSSGPDIFWHISDNDGADYIGSLLGHVLGAAPRA
jgi:hypothetical protein